MTVTALTAIDAHASLDEKLAEAKCLQLRLPALELELGALKVGQRGGFATRSNMTCSLS